MKTDFQAFKKTSVAEIALTLIILTLVTVLLLGGAYLTGFISLPDSVRRYVGGAMLAYVVLSGFIIVFNSVKFMYKKGE